MAKKRVYAIVDGIVQGVGFRFFVHRLAHRYGVTGYVRNRSDEKVELEAEGDEGVLKEFLKGVRVGPRMAHVTGMEVEWRPYEGRYLGFEIRF